MGIKPAARASVLLREVFRKRAFLNTLLLGSFASFASVQQPCSTIATVQQLRQGFVGQFRKIIQIQYGVKGVAGGIAGSQTRGHRSGKTPTPAISKRHLAVVIFWWRRVGLALLSVFIGGLLRRSETAALIWDNVGLWENGMAWLMSGDPRMISPERRL